MPMSTAVYATPAVRFKDMHDRAADAFPPREHHEPVTNLERFVLDRVAETGVVAGDDLHGQLAIRDQRDARRERGEFDLENLSNAKPRRRERHARHLIGPIPWWTRQIRGVALHAYALELDARLIQRGQAPFGCAHSCAATDTCLSAPGNEALARGSRVPEQFT